MVMIFIIIGLGLLSRRMTAYFPDVIDLFLGDSLWALMIYFIVRMLFMNWSIRKVGFGSILFCITIEFSQLYHDEWIDIIRGTTLGGLILGYGFLWSDLIAYSIGIGFGIITEILIAHTS
jgi:hypothetical protein